MGESGVLSSKNMLETYLGVLTIVRHGALILNSDGHILGVNGAFASDLGYEKESFPAKTIFEINPHINLLSWRKYWSTLLKDKRLYLETEHINTDGTIYPVKLRGVPVQMKEAPICIAFIDNVLEKDRFKQLLEITSSISNTGSWQWDVVKKEVVFTRELSGILQTKHQSMRSEDEVIELIGGLISTQELENLRTDVSNLLNGPQPGRFEREITLFFRESNEQRRIVIHAIPMLFEGQVLSIYGTVQDISSVAGRTEEMYLTQYSMDYALEIILWVDETKKIIYANRAAEKSLGYSRAQLQEMDLKQLDFHYDENNWLGLHEGDEDDTEFETYLRTSDESKLFVFVSTNLLEYGQKKYVCCFIRNLTKRKEREALLKLTQFTINQAQDIILWVDPAGRVLYYNEAAYQKLGATKKIFSRKNIFDVFPDYTEERMKQDWQSLDNGNQLHTEFSIAPADGPPFMVEASITRTIFVGKECYCLILRNIDHRIQREKELRDALKDIEDLKNELESENLRLKANFSDNEEFGNIICESPRYQEVLQQVQQVAETDTTVLITGETGTGKELLARSLHQLSNRSDRPLVTVNCGALPQNLIESELFGHEKGAFTGAYQAKIGRFEKAHRATIFLDEIGELPLELQPNLLRVLQEGEFRRVGGNQIIKVDVRVISATNRNLADRVAKGLFREDLYYRLNVFPIHNIPLRERREDIPLLINYFTQRYSKKIGKEIREIPKKFVEKLMHYEFPGNVRELENIIERAVILTPGKKLTMEGLHLRSNPSKSTRFPSLEEIQKNHILKALRRTGGKISGKGGAAQLLKINDKTLRSRMQKLGIDKYDFLKR